MSELPRRGARTGPGEIARAREDLFGPQDIPAPRRPVPPARVEASDESPDDGHANATEDRFPAAERHPDPGPGAAPPRTRPARGRPALLGLAGVLLLVTGLVLGYLLAGSAGDRAEPSHPTMLGQVVAVSDGQTASVRVGDRLIDVSVLGLDAPTGAECGAAAATDLASTTLTGQTVTLVPDPTVAEFDEQGRRLSYLVLRSQQNYTDAALTAGVARADTARPLWYLRFFTDEEATARADGKGLWGPPCTLGP